MSVGVTASDLIDGQDYIIGDNIQLLNKSYLAPPCVFLGRLKASRIYLTYHFDKQLIVPHTGSFPMAIKVDKRPLKFGNDLELYVSEIIKTKKIFILNLDTENAYYEFSKDLERVYAKKHKKFKPSDLITHPSCNIPVTKDNPRTNRNMYKIKIPIRILPDDRPVVITSKRGAYIDLADRRQLFIGDHHIKPIDAEIKKLLEQIKIQFSSQPSQAKVERREIKIAVSQQARPNLKPVQSIPIRTSLPKPSLNSNNDQKRSVEIGKKRPMASLDANENTPTPKRMCKPAHQSQPTAAENEPVAKIDRENFFRSISLKPNGLFDLPDLNEHFNKQLDELLEDETFENLGKEYEDMIREAEKKAENRVEINLEAERKRNEEIKNINNQNPLDEMSQDSEEDDLPLDKIITHPSNSQSVSQEKAQINPTNIGGGTSTDDSSNNESSKALSDENDGLSVGGQTGSVLTRSGDSICGSGLDSCELRCFEARGQKETFFSRYNSELEQPLQFGWLRKEEISDNEKYIVYSSLCGRKFKKEDLGLLTKELWSVRSLLTILNFSFDQEISVDPRESLFDAIQTRAFGRANGIVTRVKQKMFDVAQKRKSDGKGGPHDVEIIRNLSSITEWHWFRGSLEGQEARSWDWSKGKEDAVIFVSYVNDQIQKHKDEKNILNITAEYAPPKWGKSEARDANRVCCTCTDGCFTDKCECKEYTKKWFQKNYGTENPNYPSQGWFKNQKLFFENDDAKDFLLKNPIYIWECCSGCSCQKETSRRLCGNSAMGNKISNPMLVMSSRTHSGSGKLAPRLFPLQSLPEGTFIGSFPIEANCRSRGQCVGNILQNNYKKRDPNENRKPAILVQVNNYDKLWSNAVFLISTYDCQSVNNITVVSSLSRDQLKTPPTPSF